MAREPLAAEDLALLERLAERIVGMRLEVPAILALESARPVAFVAGQTMVFLAPIVQALFRIADYDRIAALVERRDALEELTVRIERHVDERERTSAAARNPKS